MPKKKSAPKAQIVSENPMGIFENKTIITEQIIFSLVMALAFFLKPVGDFFISYFGSGFLILIALEEILYTVGPVYIEIKGKLHAFALAWFFLIAIILTNPTNFILLTIILVPHFFFSVIRASKNKNVAVLNLMVFLISFAVSAVLAVITNNNLNVLRLGIGIWFLGKSWILISGLYGKNPEEIYINIIKFLKSGDRKSKTY